MNELKFYSSKVIHRLIEWFCRFTSVKVVGKSVFPTGSLILCIYACPMWTFLCSFSVYTNHDILVMFYFTWHL